MNNKQWTTVAAGLLLGLTSCAMNAEAACTHHKRVLNLGINSLSMEQIDTRCVLAPPDGQSGTFDIKVRTKPGYDVDLDTIAVAAKDSNGPVTFSVSQVLETQKILVVLVTWDGSPSAEYGYTVTVPKLGMLDPKVQIIRTPASMAYTSALLEIAKEYLDEAAYEFIARELLPIGKESAAE